MASIAPRLTFAQFQSLYGHGDRAYEYWYGEAVPKGTHTWIHALLQKIIIRLLDEAGFTAGGEIELRIDPEAHPRPDVIATAGPVEAPYPTKGVEVVVEILSAEDSMPHLRSKCRAYEAWAFRHIYVVDPSDRSILEWQNGSFLLRESLASVPASTIWSALDRELEGQRQ